jgi:hypothetical protein
LWRKKTGSDQRALNTNRLLQHQRKCQLQHSHLSCGCSSPTIITNRSAAARHLSEHNTACLSSATSSAQLWHHLRPALAPSPCSFSHPMLPGDLTFQHRAQRSYRSHSSIPCSGGRRNNTSHAAKLLTRQQFAANPLG